MSTLLSFSLHKQSFLAQLEPSLKTQLLAQASLLHIKASEHVFYFEQEAEYFYLIESGSVCLYRPSFKGDEKVFQTLEAGDSMAETLMFVPNAQYPLSAQAVTDSQLQQIPKKVLLNLCQTQPSLAMQLLEGMALAITQSLNRIDLLTISNAAQRMVTYFVDLYIQKNSAWLTLPTSQIVLARQLNIAPETFSRQMASFRKAGFIGGRNPDIVLLDIEGLCASVDLPVPKLQSHSASRQLSRGLLDCCSYLKCRLGKTTG
ncbi:Crp/Fnr family transcriptional regulator [Pseudomonas sp. F1_0610]|uniref:Crp/Fnr family transcriptional regulator n=1 Tax=Pseudomonas sp. F1_0610 TaxID=3114284 RepID=UPI0039C0D047